MNYEDMTSAEIKALLVKEMSNRETVQYMLGWLKQSYIHPADDDTERFVAINQLKAYGV